MGIELSSDVVESNEDILLWLGEIPWPYAPFPTHAWPLTRLEIARDCSAFSNALLISFTLTQRRPPPLDSVPPAELLEPSAFPKTSNSSLLEP